MLSHLLRIICAFIPIQIMEVLMIDHSFNRSRPIWPFLTIWLIRAAFMMPLYLTSGMLAPETIRLCRYMQAILTPLQALAFIMTYYDEKTSPVKIITVGIIVEGITAIFNAFAILTTSFIEGYGFVSLNDVSRPFQLMDLMMIVLSISLPVLFLIKAKAFFEKLKQYQFKHPIIIGCIIVPVYGLGIINSVFPQHLDYAVFFVIIASLSAFAIITLITFMRSLNRQRRALSHSSLMIDNHYQLMQARIDDLAMQQQEINDKMATLAKQNFPDDLTELYLKDMKQLKDNLHQSLFTHYYMIDAVLAEKAKEYREQGKEFSCQCTGLTLNQLSQQKLSQILLMLFRYIDRYDPDS